jgi:hypothetical protein
VSDPVAGSGSNGETTRVNPVVGYEPDPALAAFAEALRAVEREFAVLMETLTEPQLNWRPTDGRWSIAECIAHLTAAGRAYVVPLEQAIERGFKRGYLGGRDFQPGPLGRWFIAQMEPPPRRRLPTPRKFVPQQVEPVASLRSRYEAVHREMIDAVLKAEGLDLSRVKLSSPIMPLVRQSLGTWLGFLAAHERRHLWQARQVRQEPEFPI